MELKTRNNGIEIVDFGGLNLPLTLDCGQAFRWECVGDGIFRGVAFGREANIKATADGLLFLGADEDEINKIWLNYFDLKTDHEEILKRLSLDPYIKAAYEKYGIIRILNQDPWETLCSFIISSCNNIPRIKGIIKRLSEGFGKKVGESFTFPDAEILATKTEDELSFLKAGYRVPYILDAAKKVAEGEIDLDNIRNMDENDARKELMKIKGVGKKVADCTLLFSLQFTDVYPIDRHIERATKEYYPDGLPECFKPNSGLAQQYIFSKMIEKQ